MIQITNATCIHIFLFLGINPDVTPQINSTSEQKCPFNKHLPYLEYIVCPNRT